MWTWIQKINKKLIIAIPISMALGFLFGLAANASFLKDWIMPLTFLMVYPMMVTLKIKKVFEGGDTKAQVLSQGINFLIIPFIAYGIGSVFFKDRPYMALGLLLAALLPTSGMTISWTGFAKGNVEAAVKMTVIGLTLGSVLTPFYIQMLMGATVSVDFLSIVRQIALIVFLPMILGFLTQQALIRRFGQQSFQKEWAPKFPGLSTMGVLAIVFISIALKARNIADNPQLLLMIFIPLTLLYGVNYILSTFIAKRFLGRRDGIALVYGTVMRNLSIALAVAMNAFGEAGSDAAIVVAIAYILQVQSAAWYVKFTDRVFGAETDLVQTEPAGANVRS